MQKFKMQYGRSFLEFELPSSCKIEELSPLIANKQENNLNNKKISDAIDFILKKTVIANKERISGASRVVIVSDDNTRVTPVKALVPVLIKEIKPLNPNINIIIASGSHRNMTRTEKIEKFGEDVLSSVTVLDHEWNQPGSFKYLGKLPSGHGLKLNKQVCDDDIFLIAMGNIVPHSVTGFSGGYKILLPGLSCEETVRHVHAMIMNYSTKEIIGVANNPIRDEINSVSNFRKIDVLINTVLDANGNIISLCTGDPITSHYQGSRISKEVYGVPIKEPADIVIADSVPEYLDFWVVAKAVTNTFNFVKKGGHLVILSPCSEGLSPVHGETLLKYGYRSPTEIKKMAKDGKIKEEDLLPAAHLYQVGEALQHCNIHLVSDGLDKQELSEYGFDIMKPTKLQDLLDSLISKEQSKKFQNDGKVLLKIIHRGSEILPLFHAGRP
ncbi:MAG: lactate racemase domain-containing protein [Promethearchaeota archaeon]